MTDHANSPGASAESGVLFDLELIRRYDRNGPRYTSYPTAVEFHPGCIAQQYQLAAQRSNQPTGRPLSIYVHIPFCTSPCFYCGCNKVITRDKANADLYLHYLFREMELQSPLFDRTRVVEQLHFGGAATGSVRSDHRDADQCWLCVHQHGSLCAA
jgi:oxygen-independent coproporphyrinogen-3 oxidase